MREEREEREGYRTAGPSCKRKKNIPSTHPQTNLNISQFFENFSLSLSLSLSLSADGAADKKAATGAGADFNPAFVSFIHFMQSRF